MPKPVLNFTKPSSNIHVKCKQKWLNKTEKYYPTATRNAYKDIHHTITKDTFGCAFFLVTRFYDIVVTNSRISVPSVALVLNEPCQCGKLSL